MMDWQRVSLNMFAKCPARGNPKTRLQPPLTPGEAQRLHMQLASRTLRVLHKICDSKLVLWLDRASDHPWVERERDLLGCQLDIQSGRDLGARMSHALAASLKTCAYAILVGSDCPVLQVSHLHAAADALSGGDDAVFIPTEDGGYALIGLARHNPSLFDDIAWGSNSVMQQTREKLLGLGWRWRELETLWDVDTAQDLLWLEREGIDLPAVN